jgi:hypothetical protein
LWSCTELPAIRHVAILVNLTNKERHQLGYRWRAHVGSIIPLAGLGWQGD